MLVVAKLMGLCRYDLEHKPMAGSVLGRCSALSLTVETV